MLVFRQLFDTVSSTYTYLLGDRASGQALLIDPVFEHARRDLALLRELGLKLLATLDTHVHADHVSAAWLIKQRCGSQILLAHAAQAANVDRTLTHGEVVLFGQRHLQVRATPGHTSGCLSFVLDDHSLAFTGDSLLIRGCGRTDFQQGSAHTLFQSVRRQILALPAHCLVYPAHDYRGVTVSTVAEEKRFNPRLNDDVSEGDFTGYMNHLGLPHPKLMDIAVPANLRCGRPEHDDALPEEPGWAPLTYTFSGIWEISGHTLHERGSEFQIIDVREPHEFSDSLGHIHGARLLPLSELTSQLTKPTSQSTSHSSAIDPTRPVVLVCRSGARSAQACTLLQKACYQDVANLAGGMLRWRAEGLPVENGAQ